MKNPPPVKRDFSGLSLAVALAVALLAGSKIASADDSSGYRIVDGLAIYYATVPAEVIRGHPKGHPEAVMHGGVPRGAHVHHIMVALFDSATMERIVDAEVTAIVGEVGLAPQQKQLEPFTVAGALTYGNYYEFSNLATYTIDIEVRRPGSPEVVKTRFQYKHH